MDNFAPAYYQTNNTAWLDTLIVEAIDPSHRASCRSYGRDWDDDMVDDPAFESFDQGDDRESDAAPRDGSALATRPRPSSTPSRRRSSRNPRIPSRSSSAVHSRGLSAYHQVTLGSQRYGGPPSVSNNRQLPDGSSVVLASPASAFLRSSLGSEDLASTGDRVLDDGASIRTNTKPPLLRGYSHRSTVSTTAGQTQGRVLNSWLSRRHRPLMSPGAVPSSPAPPYEESQQVVGASVDGKAPSDRKPLHRSLSSQGWSPRQYERMSEKHRPNSMLSTLSEFSGFAPHPGVRPLEFRKVLGEAAGPTDDDTAEYPGPLSLTLIIIGICLSVFVISLDRNIITTAIPQITARFHSYEDIGWYGSAYLLTASAFQPLYGRIYMSFETKSAFLYALVVFEVGSLIAAISPSSPVLIIGRAIQGLGSAGILTGSFVVGTHSVRLQNRPVLFACVGILYAVGALCGPLLGGAFTDTIGWRWCFWINLPIGLITFVTVFFCFKHRQPKGAEGRAPFFGRILALDLIGNAILLSAATMLFLALQFSEKRASWSSSRCIGLLCGFGITTIIFICWNFYRGERALLPPRILRQRTVAASCGAAFFIYGTTLIHAYYLPIWFQAIKGTSAIKSGVNMIPYMCANAIFGLLAGIFVSKRGLFAPPAVVGCAIGCIGSGLLATLKPTTSTSMWIGFEFLVSAGIGMAIQQGFSAVQTALPLEEVPIGTAAVVASQSIGGAVFVAVGNTLLQNHLLSKQNENAIPGVNIRAVVEMGATNFRHFVNSEDLPELIKLYNESLQAVFIAAVPLMGLALVCSLFMEWRSVKRDTEATKESEDAEKA